MKKTALLIIIVALLIFVSCSTTGKLNSSYDVGSKLAEDFLSTPILKDFHNNYHRNPVLVIGLVSSSTDIDDSQISAGFKNKLIASGLVDMIVGSYERDSI